MATNTADYIWFNGKMVPWAEANVHVMSHALHYGSSVFEGVRCYETPKGPAVFRHREHAQRLLNSAKIYRFPLNYSLEEIMEATRETLRANKLNSAYIRPLAFVGNVGLGVCPPKGSDMDMIIAAFPWGAYLGEEAQDKGIAAMISSWTRVAPNTIPTTAKAGGNYLSSILIGSEARRHGYDEGMALSVEGYLSEGSGENIFIVQDNVLMTPPLSNSILPGITRDSVMKLAVDAGYKIKETNISREALYLADEVFMTGTAAEIVPVSSIDKLQIGSGKRGPVTKHLQDIFFGLFNGETEDKWGWLDYVNPQDDK